MVYKLAMFLFLKTYYLSQLKKTNVKINHCENLIDSLYEKDHELSKRHSYHHSTLSGFILKDDAYESAEPFITINRQRRDIEDEQNRIRKKIITSKIKLEKIKGKLDNIK
jgi:hypothetical protein